MNLENKYMKYFSRSIVFRRLRSSYIVENHIRSTWWNLHYAPSSKRQHGSSTFSIVSLDLKYSSHLKMMTKMTIRKWSVQYLQIIFPLVIDILSDHYPIVEHVRLFIIMWNKKFLKTNHTSENYQFIYHLLLFKSLLSRCHSSKLLS